MTAQTCYSWHQNVVAEAPPSIPCGVTNSSSPAVPCCVAGDICMSDSICKYTHSLTGGTGYYVADCTDETFESGACRRACNDLNFADIVYDATNQVWHCCSYSGNSGVPNCTSPTNQQFNARSPQELITVQSIPLSGTPTYITSSPAATGGSAVSANAQTTDGATVATVSPTSSAASAASSGLSTGAQAGIGVGVALAAILIIGLATFLIFRRRRKNKQTQENQPGYGELSGAAGYGSQNAQAENQMAYQDEPSTQEKWPRELDTNPGPQEIGGQPVSATGYGSAPKYGLGGGTHELAS